MEIRPDPNLWWSTISHLNLKRLEIEISTIDLCTVKQINDFPITQKVIRADKIEKCSNSDYLAYSHLFDHEYPPSIIIIS